MEKTVSNLIRMHVNLRDNYIQRCIEQDKISPFQAGTIPSEKEQEKAEQSEAEKEQELMAQLNKELAKSASLEAFNAERANRGLPAIDKLEFDKAKSVFDYALAAAKVLRPQWYDKINQIKIPQIEQDKPEQSQPEKGSENLGEPVLNKPNQFKKGQFRTTNPEEREENIAKEDWESRKQISAEQLDANLSKLADLPLKSEQELAEKNKPNPRKVALNKLVLFRFEAIEKLLADDDLSIYNQCLYMQSQAAILQSELQDFRRKVLDLGAAEPSKVEQKEAVQDEPKQAEESEPTLPAPEQKEADKSGSELSGTWLIYDKIDKAWAAKCNDGGFYWSSKQDDFVLKFTSEAEAKQRYDALCSRGLISGMHRANSVVIRKEEAAQGGSELGGIDGADSPTRAEYYYIVIVNHKQGGAPLYLLDFEQTSCDGVPDMTIESTSRKHNAHKFNHIKQAQNFIDLAVECKADKGYNFFIDTVENSL